MPSIHNKLANGRITQVTMKKLNEIKWNDNLAIPNRNDMAQAYSTVVVLVQSKRPKGAHSSKNKKLDFTI